MRALLQRVKSAHVTVEDRTVGAINSGLLIFLGVCNEDTELEATWIADKCLGLRIFEDADGKFNLSALDTDSEILIVPQFTLYGDTRKGKRPSFDQAAAPEVSRPLFDKFVDLIRQSGIPVQTGEFGATMEVHLVNDGPVTFMVEK